MNPLDSVLNEFGLTPQDVETINNTPQSYEQEEAPRRRPARTTGKEWEVVTGYQDINNTDVQALTRPLVDGVIERGRVHFLSGMRGAGKTTLMVDLARALAEGDTEWVGRKVNSEGGERVLLISVENGFKPELAQKYDNDIPRNIMFLNSKSEAQNRMLKNFRGNLNSPEFHEAVEDMIHVVRANDCSVVVFDHASGLVRDAEGMNSGGSAKPFMAALARIADETDAAIILIGHHNKMDKFEGNTAFVNQSRVHMSVHGVGVSRGKPRLVITNRVSSDSTIVFEAISPKVPLKVVSDTAPKKRRTAPVALVADEGSAPIGEVMNAPTVEPQPVVEPKPVVEPLQPVVEPVAAVAPVVATEPAKGRGRPAGVSDEALRAALAVLPNDVKSVNAKAQALAALGSFGSASALRKRIPGLLVD